MPFNRYNFFHYRNPDDINGGELTLGGSDSSLYTGNFTYLPLSKETYWEIDMDAVNVGKESDLACKGGCQAIVDSGTSLLVGPVAEVTAINKAIGATKIPFTSQYIVDCSKLDTLPEVAFTLGGQKYSLTGKEYVLKVEQAGQAVCMSGFAGLDTPYGLWILGDIFMGKYYTEFDAGKKRVGFANAVQH